MSIFKYAVDAEKDSLGARRKAQKFELGEKRFFEWFPWTQCGQKRAGVCTRDFSAVRILSMYSQLARECIKQDIKDFTPLKIINADP